MIYNSQYWTVCEDCWIHSTLILNSLHHGTFPVQFLRESADNGDSTVSFHVTNRGEVHQQKIMNLIQGIFSAESGLKATQFALDASSSNIANLQSTGYRRKEVLFFEAPGGGVSAVLRREPSEGLFRSSAFQGVHLVEEMADQIVYRSHYTANARSLRTSSQIKGSLLDIFT